MEKTQKLTARHVMVVIGVALCTLSYFSIFGSVLAVFVVPITEAFSVSRAVASGIYTAVAIASMILGLFAFKLLKLMKINILIGLGGVIAFIGCMICANAFNITILLIGFVVAGITGFTSGYLTCGQVVSRWFMKSRGLVIGIMTAASSMGAMILSPIIAGIITNDGYKRAFLVEGIILLICISFAGFVLIRESPESCGMKAFGDVLATTEKMEQNKKVLKEEIPGMTLGEAKKTILFYLVIVLAFLVTFMNQSVVSQQSALITDKGFTAVQASLIISVYSLAAMINKIIFGIITDKFGLKWSTLYCSVGFAVACVFLIIGQSYAMMIAYAVLVGLFSAITASYPLLANTHLFEVKEIGAIQGFSQTCGSAGAMVAPIIMGSVFTVTKSYNPIIIVIGLLAIIFAIITFRIMSEKNSYYNRNK